MNKIAVNAGHCPGLDSGAVGPNGLQEADVVKIIGKQLCEILNGVGYETKFIQENELQDICDIANNFGADLFISIHCNSADDPSAHGMEIFTTPGFTRADAFATCVMDQLIKSQPTSDLSVRADWVDGDVDKEANFYVLRNTDAPAVLVETAFISNPTEEQLLGNPEAQTAIARSLARGITDYQAED